jgi:type IV pilus assembly protein PilB
MAANSQPSTLSGLARALVQAARLTEADAEALLLQAAVTKISFVEQLASSNKISALEIARFASDTFGYPLLDLNAFDEVHIQKNVIDRKLIAAHRVIPLHKRGNRISIGIADPTNVRALDEIRFQTGLAVDPVIVEENKLAPLLAKLSESTEDALKSLASDDVDLEFPADENQEKPEETSTAEVDDAPVVRFIQKMLLDAISEGASSNIF